MVFKSKSYRADGIEFCSWHFSRTILRQQGDYRARNVNRFREFLRAMQSLIKVGRTSRLFSVFMDGVHELLNKPSYIRLQKTVLVHFITHHEPAHKITILITWATSEGSGESAHSRSLARTIAVRTHKVWK